MEPRLDEENAQVFGEVLDLLGDAGVPFMIGGAFAMNHYVGLWRDTKDLDIFCERGEGIRALEVLARNGFYTRIEEDHWLGKAIKLNRLIDFVWGGGNWATFVDPDWLTRARGGQLLGRDVLVVAPEDIILSKAYVAGRERYDGADISHLIRACGRDLDFADLARRFGDHWPLLLHYLVLYRFVYPEEREVVPAQVIHDLAQRIGTDAEVADDLTFRGPLVDRYGYFHDLDEEGFPDPREDMARRAGLDTDAVTFRRDQDREALNSGKIYLPPDTSTNPTQ